MHETITTSSESQEETLNSAQAKEASSKRMLLHFTIKKHLQLVKDLSN